MSSITHVLGERYLRLIVSLIDAALIVNFFSWIYLNWFVIMTGIVVLLGHYLDVFNMVMPATVGDQWSIGVPEYWSVGVLE